MQNTEKNKGLECIRALACCMIFYHHLSTTFSIWNPGPLGRAGVTIFILLSGFLAGRYEKDTYADKSLWVSCREYGLRKLKKFYLPYVISFVAGMGLVVLSYIKGDVVGNVPLKAISYLLLWQSLIPDPEYYYGINGVAWYLSMIMILYFITPVLKKLLLTSDKSMFLGAGVCIAVLALINVLTPAGDIGTWFIYISPFSRVFEYSLGIIVGRELALHDIGKHIEYKNKKLAWTFCEIGCLASLVLFMLMNVPMKYQQLTFYILPALIIICVFFSGGYLSEILSNKITFLISRASMYIFIWHNLIFVYIHIINKYILHLNNGFAALLAALTAFLICILYCHFIQNNIILRRKKKNV